MHIPVMLLDVIKYLDIKPNSFYIDATFGLGGHTNEILKYLNSDGKLLIFDKDINSYNLAKSLYLNDFRVQVYNKSFEDILCVLNKSIYLGAVSGILLDLGLSVFQIRDITRGFGFDIDGFLDMRLDVDEKFRFIDWINFVSFDDLENMFLFFDSSLSVKVLSRKIIESRSKRLIKTTGELFDIFLFVFGFQKSKSIFSKLFQFFRIFINDDFLLLNLFLMRSSALLKLNGVLLLISFNPLEEYVIKNFLIRNINSLYEFSLFRPSIREVNLNFLSRSAKLHILKKML